MSNPSLTPQEAAERAKVSRATIVRALQDRGLHGFRSNSGRWSIRPEDLDRWAKKRRKTVQTRAVNTDHEHGISIISAKLIQSLSEQMESARQQIAERDARIARLEAETAAQAAHLTEAAAERDTRIARLEAEAAAQAAPLVEATADRDTRLAWLDAEAEASAQRLADTIRDRDAWQAQAQRLAERSAPHPAPDVPDQPRGLRLFRLFRRSG